MNDYKLYHHCKTDKRLYFIGRKRQHMETLPALQALCEKYIPVFDGSPHKRPVILDFRISSGNNLLMKHRLSRDLRRHDIHVVSLPPWWKLFLYFITYFHVKVLSTISETRSLSILIIGLQLMGKFIKAS